MKVISNMMGGSSSGDQQPPLPGSHPITVHTAEVDVRLNFLRKVYTLLTINFAITIGVSCAFSFIRPIRQYIVSNIWILFVAFACTVVMLLVLSCIRLKYPVNIILLYVFVLAMSSLVGCIVARYYNAGAGLIVLQAFIATAAVFLSITFYVAATKKDFSFLKGFLAAGSIILIILIIFNFALGFLFVKNGTRRWVSFLISVAGYVFISSSSPTFPILFPSTNMI